MYVCMYIHIYRYRYLRGAREAPTSPRTTTKITAATINLTKNLIGAQSCTYAILTYNVVYSMKKCMK